ncbi:MAG: hypothetical protein HYX92_02205 [Chloroflexi bacterium]|nr:hypothetical protein [Chloroflexota bacterium]
MAGEVGAKQLALLTYLALAAPLRQARSRLAALLWSEKSEEASRYRLRHALWMLHRTLGDSVPGADDDACWLDPEEGTWVDAREFRRGCRQEGIDLRRSGPPAAGDDDSAALQGIVDLYRGELLAGLVVRDAPEFEEWLLVERESLDLLYLEALWRLGNAQIAAGSLGEAAATLDRLVQADPLRERSYCALAGLYVRLDDRSAAVRICRRCSTTINAELGVSPCPDPNRWQRPTAPGDIPASGEVERASRLMQGGRYREAWAVCRAAVSLCSDPVARSQLALLQAEIALAQDRPKEALSLVQAARQAIGRLAAR